MCCLSAVRLVFCQAGSLSAWPAADFFYRDWREEDVLIACLQKAGAYLFAMEKLTLYLKESYQELVNNVSWPTTAQLQESTLVVLVTAATLAILIFLMDGLCSVFFKTIYGIWE